MNEFKRARGAKEKELRRTSILQAAESLFQSSTLPTTAKIGKEAGVAKGTLYLYFRSKEEIFLALLEEYYLQWLTSLGQTIEQNAEQLEAIIEQGCQFIEKKPMFFQLASLSSSVIEPNVDSKILIAHKNEISKAVKNVARTLHAHFPHVEPDDGANLIMLTYGSLIGLWQISHPSESISKVLESPSLKLLKPDFSFQARHTMLLLWQAILLEKKTPKAGILKRLFS